jgi:uncharacterized protein
VEERHAAGERQEDPERGEWRSLRERIIAHFQGYERLRPLRFCLLLTIECMAVSFVIAIPVHLIIRERPRPLAYRGAEPLIRGVLVAPIFETLLFQAALIALLRLLRRSLGLQIGLSAAAFAIAHYFGRGLEVALAAGVVGGAYYAFSYARWARVSHWTAFWVTAVSHAIHNGCLMIMYLLLAGLSGRD